MPNPMAALVFDFDDTLAPDSSTAFLACVVAPFPGFRDLGLTAGLGLLACMAASFLVLPALLLALDRGPALVAALARRLAEADP